MLIPLPAPAKQTHSTAAANTTAATAAMHSARCPPPTAHLVAFLILQGGASVQLLSHPHATAEDSTAAAVARQRANAPGCVLDLAGRRLAAGVHQLGVGRADRRAIIRVGRVDKVHVFERQRRHLLGDDAGAAVAAVD